MYNLRRKIGFKITKLNSKDEPSILKKREILNNFIAFDEV